MDKVSALDVLVLVVVQTVLCSTINRRRPVRAVVGIVFAAALVIGSRVWRGSGSPPLFVAVPLFIVAILVLWFVEPSHTRLKGER